MKKRTIALMLALVLVIGCAVGGTIAWLTDKTEEVKNTFSPSTIDITLTETDTDLETEGVQHNYDMIPGYTITKDPKVTVKAKSEACYLFVEIKKDGGFDNYMTYTIATGWTELREGSGIYWREVAASETDQVFEVLANNVVTVNDTVTTEMMTDNFTQPTLTFTAYAHQLYMNQNNDNFTPADAWDNIINPTTAA